MWMGSLPSNFSSSSIDLTLDDSDAVGDIGCMLRPAIRNGPICDNRRIPVAHLIAGQGSYEDVKGYCASVPLVRVAELDYVMTPGRYVGLPDEEDDFNFPERFAALKAEFEAQLVEETKLNQAIAENLAKVKL